MPDILSVFAPTTKRTRANPLNQLDSLKSRLQTIKHPISVPTLAALVYREEGVRGFYRGLWIPLVTITFVRMSVLFLFAWHSPPRSGVDDVTRSGLFYNLLRNKGSFPRCSPSQPGCSPRHLVIGRTWVRPGLSFANPRMLTIGLQGRIGRISNLFRLGPI